jgi:hypothetical protein
MLLLDYTELMFSRNFIFIKYKLFFALLGFSALVTEVAVTSERGTFDPAHFFGYFTVLMNILVFISFLLSAIVTATGKHKPWLDILRSVATVYIVIVGIGFALLLSGLSGVEFTAVPWDNMVLHYIIPAVALVDFLIDRPKTKFSFKSGLVWAAVPLVYAAFSIIRGQATGWFPYPFLDPVTSGWVGVIVGVGGLTLVGIAIIAFVTRVSRFKTSR